MSKTLKEYMELYDKLGLSYIPVDYQTKKPSIDWKPFQERKLTEEEKERYFNNGHDTNLSIVCGKISNNLSVIDFDKPEAMYEFFPKDKKDILKATLSVKTARGYHIYIRTPQPLISRKIPGIVDILSDGHLALAPPSKHPSGAMYEMIGPEEIICITDFNEVFWKKAETLGYYKEVGMRTRFGTITKLPDVIPGCIHKLLNGTQSGKRNDTGFAIATFLKNQNKTREEIKTVLFGWNDKNSPPLTAKEVGDIVDSVIENCYGVGCSTPLLAENCTSRKGDCVFEDIKTLVKDNTETVVIKRPIVEGDTYEFEITIMGKKLIIKSDEMLSPKIFKQRWLEEHGRLVNFRDENWRLVVNFWNDMATYKTSDEMNTDQYIVDSILENLSECDVTLDRALATTQKKYLCVDSDISELPDNMSYVLYYPNQNIKEIIDSSRFKVDIRRIHNLMGSYLASTSKTLRVGSKIVRFWAFKNSLLDIDWRKRFVKDE